jgi:hypothetical protein
MAADPHRAGGSAVLRALLAALIAANLLFFAYSRGWLDGFAGLKSTGDREPERLASQVRPQTIRLLPMSATASGAREPTSSCFETPTFGAAEATGVEAMLVNNLPVGVWIDNRGERTVGTRAEVTHTYRVTTSDPALAARVAALKLDAAGRGFSPCPPSDRPR